MEELLEGFLRGRVSLLGIGYWYLGWETEAVFTVEF